MATEVSAVTKAYEFLRWLIPQITRFPRDQRFTLGQRIEEGALDILELLIEASYTREREDILRRANLRLEKLRYLVRLARDLDLLTLKQYETSAKSMLAIGTEIGGWLRYQSRST